MGFIICLLALFSTALTIAQFIKVLDDSSTFYALFTRLFIATTVIVTATALIFTGGKTLTLFAVLLLMVLYYRKFFRFTHFDKEIFLSDSKKMIWALPVVGIQLFFLFDFSNGEFFMPSEDLLFYGSLVENLPKYQVENVYGVLNEMYPVLFSGLSPYHYFEIWLGSILHYFSGLSGTKTLLYCVYPFLIFVLYVAFLGLIEKVKGRVLFVDGLLGLGLFFIGPLSFPIYETLFNDGNFFDSIVFVTTGFVKQSLPYSYFGQKHLFVYLLIILLFDCVLSKKYDCLIAFTLFAMCVSFGIVPGVFTGLGLYLLFFKKERKIKYLMLFVAGASCALACITIFGYEESKEIGKQTFYFDSFLTELNFKGEILRVVAKFISAPLWLTILFLPYLILFISVSRRKELSQFKTPLFFIGFSFIGGIAFSAITQGTNSDQFITNLVPLVNVLVIMCWIKLLFGNGNTKILKTIFLVIVAVNFSFTVQNHMQNNQSFTAQNDEDFNKQIDALIEKSTSKKIAYLFSDSIAKVEPPIMWYALVPLKSQRIKGGVKLLNINFPYYDYASGSTTKAYSIHNQMKYFFPNDSSINSNEFGAVQLQFLKKYQIEFLVLQYQAVVPHEIRPFILSTYFNKKTLESFYVLKY